MIKINDVVGFIDNIAPFSSQEKWDNSGFLVGDGENKVKKIIVALDATADVIKEAENEGANLIVTHHPIIFGKLGQFHPDNLAYIAAQKNISVICAHTCLDVADGGVNDCLAEKLSLSNVRKCSDELKLLRIGELENELECSEFLNFVHERLGIDGIKYTASNKKIKTVAVCGGSGAEFYKEAFECGADAYVTADIKHNYFIEFKRYGLCVLDAGHFCTENVIVESLAERISSRFADTDVAVSKVSSDPANYWKA